MTTKPNEFQPGQKYRTRIGSINTITKVTTTKTTVEEQGADGSHQGHTTTERVLEYRTEDDVTFKREAERATHWTEVVPFFEVGKKYKRTHGRVFTRCITWVPASTPTAAFTTTPTSPQRESPA